MKHFLISFVIGFITFLVVCSLIEFYQPNVTNNYSYKYWYMEKHSDEISTLLLGNSYIENAINPFLIGNGTFTLASSGRWIYYDNRLLAQYISAMPNLKQVIFGMGYMHPFCQSYHYWTSDYEEHEKYMYEKFMKIPYDDGSNHWLGFYRGYIDNKTLRDILLCDSLGYEKVDGQSNNWQEEHNVDSMVIYNENTQKLILEYTNYLKDMARLCYLNNVRFIVITPPCHDSYNVDVRQEGLDILHGMIDAVRTEYPIEYVDYLQDKEFRTDSIYYNCSHLNSVGADLFALRVKEDFGL